MAKTKVHGEYLDPSVISGQTQVTAVGADSVLILDATDNALKKALLSDVIETVGSTPTFTSLTVDDITIDGSTISDAGDITIDAGGGDIIFADGGTQIADFENSSSDFKISSLVSNKDLILGGNDNGSFINALTLDMSDSGTALFNHKVDIATIGQLANVANDLTIYSSTSGHNGLRFHVNGILPTDNAGAIVNNDADLGDPSYRFKDLYLGGKIYSNANGTGGTKATLADFTSSGSIRSILLKGAENTSNQVFLDVVKDINGTETTLFSIADTKVGIGTTAPAETLHIKRADGTALIVESSNDQNNTGDRINIEFRTDAAQGIAKIIGGKEGNYQGSSTRSGYLSFQTINANSYGERMRIDSSGRVGIGLTTPSDNNTKCLYLKGDENVMSIRNLSTVNAGERVSIDILDHNGTRRGYVSVDTSGTLFSTSSDYRLKNVIEPVQNGIERINKLKPVKFEWKETGKKEEGFIAHEVDEIFKDAVGGEKDAVHEDGSIDGQTMDYGRITPLLVKAIQEQQEQIEQLKSEIEELKA